MNDLKWTLHVSCHSSPTFRLLCFYAGTILSAFFLNLRLLCFYAGSIFLAFFLHICNCGYNCTLNNLTQIILHKISVNVVTDEHGSNVSNNFWWKRLSIHWKSLRKTCTSWCWQNLHCRERIVTSTSIELGSNVRIP